MGGTAEGAPAPDSTSFRDRQLLGASFEHVDLTGARFDRVDLTRASLRMVDLADVEIRDTALTRVRMRGVELMDVDGEWSFIETLRHLCFATSSWLRRAIQGDPAPWHPLELPWDTMPDTPGIPRDRQVRPPLDEALALRLERSGQVRDYLATMTPAQLTSHTEVVEGVGWPPPQSFPVKECLDTLINEEWWHRQYAERDLAALEDRQRQES